MTQSSPCDPATHITALTAAEAKNTGRCRFHVIHILSGLRRETMGSGRAARGSPWHSEAGHPPRPAGQGGSVRAGGVRAASPHRHSPRPRQRAGQGGIPGRRSNRHPAAAPEPAGRSGKGSPEGITRQGRGARETGGATPHPANPGSPRHGAASPQTPRPLTRRWQREKMT